MIQKTLESLKRRGFIPHYFDTLEQAKAFVLGELKGASSVGFGGSMTAKEMGLDRALEETGTRVHWHWNAGNQDRPRVLRDAMEAEAYICSANAITASGHILNIDGNCNRVAATLFGPQRLFIIAGKNKLVDGSMEDAVARVKQCACGPNARRLHLDTPCAHTGHCTETGECFSPDRMCNALVCLSACPSGREIHVVLMGQEAGY